ncbi:hypothetical protein ACQY0O_007301 [Thecaphora frezii]
MQVFSGEAPKVPVVSKKSGSVYEQRLIAKYAEENGKDPVTGDELLMDDLIEIKSNSFTLKKHYDNLRQELALPLYANDANARVIARLLMERDQAREALASIQATIGAGGGAASGSRQAQDVEMSEASNGAGGLAASIVETIDTTAQRLSSQRKAKFKRKAPEGYATAAEIGSFAEAQTIPSMHSTKPASVLVYDRSADKMLATLKEHTKKATSRSAPRRRRRARRLAATGTAEGTIRAWDIKQGAKVTTFRNQLRGKVSSLHFSENGYYLAASSEESEPVEFLSVVGKEVKVFANKSSKPLYAFDGSAVDVMEARRDHVSGSLIVTGLDRTVRVLGTV